MELCAIITFFEEYSTAVWLPDTALSTYLWYTHLISIGYSGIISNDRLQCVSPHYGVGIGSNAV